MKLTAKNEGLVWTGLESETPSILRDIADHLERYQIEVKALTLTPRPQYNQQGNYDGLDISVEVTFGE